MVEEALKITPKEINSKNVSAYIGMGLNLGSVAMMVATVYQMTRLIT